MPVAALLAPALAEAIGPALGIAAGGLGGTALEAGLGAGLGAGSGALFGEVTGGDPGKGALSGALGGAAGPIGGVLGEATGIGSTAGAVLGGAAGGGLGADVTGGNILTGALEGAAAPAVNAALGGSLSTPSAPSTTVTPTSPASSPTGAVGSAGSPGAATAGQVSPIPLDPTSGVSGLGGGPTSAPASGGAPPVDGAGAMGLSDPNALANLTYAPTGSQAFVPGSDVTIGGGGGGGGLFGGDIGSKLMGFLQNNPGALLSGGLLASQLFKGNEQYPAEQALQGLASNVGSTGGSLSSYINTGTLPPGAQQAVTQATDAAKASTRQNYAQLGLTGSSMETEALGNIDRQAAAQKFQFADQLLQEGANYTALSGEFYHQLLQSQMAQDREFQNALLSFAGGLGGLRAG